jgi:uncharacterized protein YlxW (UPF0749 family)
MTSDERPADRGPDPEERPAEEPAADSAPDPAVEETAETEETEKTAADDGAAGAAPPAPRRRRDPLAAALIGVLTLLLGFAFAVQVRSAGTDEALAGAREEDLVRILDQLNTSEERLRARIAEQRAAIEDLTSSDNRSTAALEEARERAEAIGILNGTVAATGPGLTMTIRDPADEVRVADLLDAIQELRGAGAETMQIDGVRVGVSTAVTGEPGALSIDGRPISSPYEFIVIGDPQNLEPALNIPGGVVQRIANRGGSVDVVPSDQVTVDALRPLDEPQYAETDG